MARDKSDVIRALLSKTIERGCTIGEEAAAVAKVVELIKLYGLNVQSFAFMWPKTRWNLDGSPVKVETRGRSGTDRFGDDEGIGKYIRQQLMVVKTTRQYAHPRTKVFGTYSVGMSYHEILSRVWARFPGCRTSIASIQWYASHMRKEGMDLPLRPRH